MKKAQIFLTRILEDFLAIILVIFYLIIVVGFGNIVWNLSILKERFLEWKEKKVAKNAT